MTIRVGIGIGFGIVIGTIRKKDKGKNGIFE